MGVPIMRAPVGSRGGSAMLLHEDVRDPTAAARGGRIRPNLAPVPRGLPTLPRRHRHYPAGASACRTVHRAAALASSALSGSKAPESTTVKQTTPRSLNRCVTSRTADCIAACCAAENRATGRGGRSSGGAATTQAVILPARAQAAARHQRRSRRLTSSRGCRLLHKDIDRRRTGAPPRRLAFVVLEEHTVDNTGHLKSSCSTYAHRDVLARRLTAGVAARPPRS
jgi:hypothetical protein